jgi:hypothetical protein
LQLVASGLFATGLRLSCVLNQLEDIC